MSLCSDGASSSDADRATSGSGPSDPAEAADGVKASHLLKMKEIIENQCFEMNVKLGMERHKDVCEHELDMSRCEEEIEQARLAHCNKTLILTRMQMWNVIIQKIVQSDADAEVLKALVDQNTVTCEKTLNILKETRELQDQITQTQKERLELKGEIKKKMLEINELKRAKENPHAVHQKAKERAEAVLLKYQKVTRILQNVLQGIILASKVNWVDDPKLRDIAMGLEHTPD